MVGEAVVAVVVGEAVVEAVEAEARRRMWICSWRFNYLWRRDSDYIQLSIILKEEEEG